MIEFGVLGALEVVRDGVRVPVASRRQRALIVRLLLGRGQVVPAAALVDALWEDGEQPGDARHAVHTYVSRVRAVLGPALVTRPPGYLLAVGPDAVDADRFEAAAARATGLLATDPGTAVELLDGALARWRGPAYAEFAGGFAQAAAVRLEELRLAARAGLGEALLALGALDRAIGELVELVGVQPLREGPHGLLMRALYRAGRQTEALDVFGRLRKRLRDELGLDPSAALRELHEQVLRQAIPAAPASATVPASVAVPAPRPALPRSRFVGRDEELARLVGTVGEGRLVTLVGPGGVGKTRLARELAARLGADDRPVWWVDLVPARDPADLPYRVVDALGLPEPAEGDIEQFVVDALRAARALLVVDNCEHVIAPAAGLVARIGAACPGVAVLATSRERLAIDGEQVLAVSPLPAASAVALFADRLQAAGGPALSGSDAELVTELCRQVDRLPLAIELAAARARSLGIAAVTRRPALDVLTGGRRTDQPRHRSLRAVLDWSHDLLDSAERSLFRRLAAFGGSFTLDDAEEVCAGGGLPRLRVATALAGLVDKSMVSGPERDCYRLLESIRAYAAQQLARHGEDRWLAAAHARHFTGFAEAAGRGYRTSEGPLWSDRIAQRLDELRAAHRWACAARDADLAIRLAVAVADYAMYHMRFELQDWAEAAAALPTAQRHPLRPAALASAAAGAWTRGDFARAERLARQGLAATPDGDPAAALPLLVLGDLTMSAGRFADSLVAYRRAAALAGDDQPRVACEGLGGQAIALSYQGEAAEAIRLAEAGERVAAGTGAPSLVAMARYYAGECRMLTDPAAALALLDEARRLAGEAGALFVVGVATLSSVSIRARSGADPVEALAAYREAIEHWRRVGNRTQQWVTLRNLVPVLVRARHDELAVTLHAALASAPVRLPADVPVPEAEALAVAVAEARTRLGDGAASAAQRRAAGVSIDELVATVLALVPPMRHESRAGGGPRQPAQPTGSSR